MSLSNTSKLFYKHQTVDNQRFTVIFLHGIMGRHNNFFRISKKFLENGMSTIILDQRGHGRSHQPQEGYSSREYAQDIEELIEELIDKGKLSEVVIVGHSMGAMVGVNLLAQRRKEIRGFIAIDGGFGISHWAVELWGHLKQIPTPAASKEEIREYCENFFSKEVAELQDRNFFLPWVYSNFVPYQETGQLNWHFSVSAMDQTLNEFHQEDFWSYWEKINSPVLLIRGDQSKVFLKETYQKALSMNSFSTGVEISNAGHWLHTSHFDEFLEEALKFLQKLN